MGLGHGDDEGQRSLSSYRLGARLLCNQELSLHLPLQKKVED